MISNHWRAIIDLQWNRHLRHLLWTPQGPFRSLPTLLSVWRGVENNAGGDLERALVVVPKANRLIALQGDHSRMALLEDVIEHFAKAFFPVTKLSRRPCSV